MESDWRSISCRCSSCGTVSGSCDSGQETSWSDLSIFWKSENQWQNSLCRSSCDFPYFSAFRVASFCVDSMGKWAKHLFDVCLENNISFDLKALTLVYMSCTNGSFPVASCSAQSCMKICPQQTQSHKTSSCRSAWGIRGISPSSPETSKSPL